MSPSLFSRRAASLGVRRGSGRAARGVLVASLVAASCASEPGDPQPEGSRGGAEYVFYASLTSDTCLNTCSLAFDGLCDEPYFCGTGTDCTDCGGEPTTPNLGPEECVDTCRYANDGACDVPYLCSTGTDCTDCAGRGESCDDSCEYAYDGECDAPRWCARGTDCADCRGPVDLEMRAVVVVVADEACEGATLYQNGGRLAAIQVTAGATSSQMCSGTQGQLVKLTADKGAIIELRGTCNYVHEQEPVASGTCTVVCLGCAP